MRAARHTRFGEYKYDGCAYHSRRGDVEREITNYRRAVARGDFRSLETALGAAQERQATLQTELARLDGNPQQAAVQLTPAALDQHLQGLTEKLRAG